MEETRKLLEESCTQRVQNSSRIKKRSHYPLPKVAATRTPQLDGFMRLEVSNVIKAGDKELAKLQTFVLDALATLTLTLEWENRGYDYGKNDIMQAVTTAVELLGNASARISHLKVVTELNKSLLPIVQEDDNFKESSSSLFGKKFARKSKDLVPGPGEGHEFIPVLQA